MGLRFRGDDGRGVAAIAPEASEFEAVMRYHERSKHHFNRFARGPGELDWANQPDPFRRYAGAVLTRLPVLGPEEEPVSPVYESLYARGADLHVRGAGRARWCFG